MIFNLDGQLCTWNISLAIHFSHTWHGQVITWKGRGTDSKGAAHRSPKRMHVSQPSCMTTCTMVQQDKGREISWPHHGGRVSEEWKGSQTYNGRGGTKMCRVWRHRIMIHFSFSLLSPNYSVVQNLFSPVWNSHLISAKQNDQPMHSQLALTEHASLNLAPLILLGPVLRIMQIYLLANKSWSFSAPISDLNVVMTEIKMYMIIFFLRWLLARRNKL